MQTPFSSKKTVASLTLVFFLLSNFSLPTLFAEQGGNTRNTPQEHVEKTTDITQDAKNTPKTNKPDHDLRDSFSGKELERVKTSVKGKDHYTLLVRSNDGLAGTEGIFDTEDKSIRVQKVGDTAYLVELPVGTKSFSGERVKVDNGVIPAQIGGYDVVQPEVFETLGTGSGYLSGEATDKLWGMDRVGVPSFAEELSQKNKIKVGVLDTGIDTTHRDLSGNADIPLSYDFVNALSGSTDDNGHGTEVAGVIGAQVNGAGVFGSDPSADLVSLKVLDANGVGTTYDVLEAIAYAKANHIPVLNVSFGGTGNPVGNPVCEAITDAKNNGVITVVSAGNAGVDASNTIPAACPDAVTVGAIDQNSAKATFSNYGSTVDVYAPGTNVYTTAQNNGYTSVNGTSFSAPLVAGLMAKELAYNGGITYDQLVGNIANNYHLVTNSTLGTIAGAGGSLSGGIVSGSGIMGSGSTASGSIQAPPIDYSTYHYYSGTFLQDGKTYGNSLYPDSLGFQSLNLPGVQVLSYAEYMSLLKTQQGTFKALSIPTSGLVGEWLLNGNVNDTSGNGNNGTATNVTWVDIGNNRKAAQSN